MLYSCLINIAPVWSLHVLKPKLGNTSQCFLLILPLTARMGVLRRRLKGRPSTTCCLLTWSRSLPVTNSLCRGTSMLSLAITRRTKVGSWAVSTWIGVHLSLVTMVPTSLIWLPPSTSGLPIPFSSIAWVI